MATRLRNPGEFCWINMLTSKTAEARQFFGQLLGWTFQDLPQFNGHAIQVAGRDIGGLFDLDDPKTPPGTPACIGVMVKVASADAAAAKVVSLRGRAMPPFDIADHGRMAVCFDPNGAQFDVWEPKSHQGTDVDATLHGAPSWFENLTTDVGRASTFYASLFGWKPETMQMPGMSYTTFKLGDVYAAGMMQILPHMGPMPPLWATYFTVNDADATARDAAGLGGNVCFAPHDIPDVGRICGITSPQGVTFYVIRYVR